MDDSFNKATETKKIAGVYKFLAKISAGTTLNWFEVPKWGAQNDTLIDPHIQNYGSTDHKKIIIKDKLVYSHKMRTLQQCSRKSLEISDG